MNPTAQGVFVHTMELVAHLLHQQRHDKNKLYSLWAPEVECIYKGKSHQRYEFGVKRSVATTKSKIRIDGFPPGLLH